MSTLTPGTGRGCPTCSAYLAGAFEESVSRSVRHPYAEARTLYEWGLMYAGEPDPRQAREPLEMADEVFRRLGAPPYSKLAQKAISGTG
jgi:hypothetical protein